MEWICLFFPACIAMNIRCRRIEKLKMANVREIVFKWTGWVLALNILGMGIITYILGIEGVVEEAFNSFSFFIKYILIETSFALFLPFLVEIIENYFEISVKIGESDEKK